MLPLAAALMLCGLLAAFCGLDAGLGVALAGLGIFIGMAVVKKVRRR